MEYTYTQIGDYIEITDQIGNEVANIWLHEKSGKFIFKALKIQLRSAGISLRKEN